MNDSRYDHSLCLVNVPYDPPHRFRKRSDAGGLQWCITVDHSEMSKRSKVMMLLDPSLPPEDVAGFVFDTWGGFLCRHCGSPLIFDGQNGAGTPCLLCKHCAKKMSIWNTYELTIWQYKKTMFAMLHYWYGGSVGSASVLYGVGTGLLNEIRFCLPNVRYSRDGPLYIIEYDSLRFGIVTIDMVYKGRRGVMLSVCGGLNTTSIGNEHTGEGLTEFFDELEEKMDVDQYVFVMDMRLSVAKMILDRFGEKAVIILQNHTMWGDALVYFYHDDGWYTLHLRTDAFTEPSQKRCEAELLGVGEIELYQGLKGVNAGFSLRDVTELRLRMKAEELINQIKNTMWNETGRVDLVMRPKFMKLNGILRELQRRGIDVTEYSEELQVILHKIIDEYAASINRTVKKKIVTAWSFLKVLKDDVERLSEALLKEPLPEKKKGKKTHTKKGSLDVDLVTFVTKPELMYRGRIDDERMPEQACWILGLLQLIFEGKEITTNPCEGRFGVIGMTLRQGRSISLKRALTKVHLQNQSVGETANWLVDSYPLFDSGKRGERGDRARLEIGKRYQITYVDRLKNKTERVIDVLRRKRKRIIAYCHLRQEVRTFNRSRIQQITPVPLRSK